MPKTVVVTGAAGFIGSHVAERLVREGFRVVGLDNFCDFYDPAAKRQNVADLVASDRFSLVEADIRDAERMFETFDHYRPEVVLHLAAMAGVRPSIEAPALYAAVNVDGTVNLLQASVRAQVQRFLFASSSSVYGNNPKVPFAEDDRVDHPISPYAATKKAGEMLAHTYAHLYGIEVVCLRFFTVFGPRQRPDLAIAKFMRLMRDNQEVPVYGDGSTSRDYTYIDDIVDGVIAAMTVPGRYSIYNLGGSNPVTLSTLVETLTRVTGIRARLRRLPEQPGDVQRTFADLTRSRRDLGYEPKVGLEEGIARQWEWFRSRGPSSPAKVT